jgi:hypothetical protein
LPSVWARSWAARRPSRRRPSEAGEVDIGDLQPRTFVGVLELVGLIERCLAANPSDARGDTAQPR